MGGTFAYRVEIAEIGAALSSGDAELWAAIVQDDRLWNDHVSQDVHRGVVSDSLRELIDGGALANQPAGYYVHAFQLLCAALGIRLAEAVVSTEQLAFEDDPFDIPFDDTASIRFARNGTGAPVVIFDVAVPQLTSLDEESPALVGYAR